MVPGYATEPAWTATPSIFPPHEWLDSMNRSDADLAAGRIVPASVVHAELDATIAELEADEPAKESKAANRRATPHQF